MPWLRLLRLPTVFTALGNVMCGFFVSNTQNKLPETIAQPWFWLLLASSAGLYLGGMVLNDVFDADLDRRERPERPIPSGEISARAASVFGWSLIAVGILSAWLAGVTSKTGYTSLNIAITLAIAVALYDVLLKNTRLGPLGMGTCRALNVLLGASCSGTWNQVFMNPQLTIAIALGVYVFGVTWFAQNEAGTSSRISLFAGLAVALIGISVNVLSTLSSDTPNGQGASIALGLVAANVAIRGIRAIRAKHSVLLQKTVGFMLLNIVFIDATMVFFATGSARLAATVVILVIPATLMKRFIPLS